MHIIEYIVFKGLNDNVFLLQEACRREVEEETGLKCEPETLIAVEFGSGGWQRYSFTARVTGIKYRYYYMVSIIPTRDSHSSAGLQQL